MALEKAKVINYMPYTYLFIFIQGNFAMLGGNFSETNSVFIDNYGFFAGTIYATQLATVKFYKCNFINQSATASGFCFILYLR